MLGVVVFAIGGSYPKISNSRFKLVDNLLVAGVVSEHEIINGTPGSLCL